MASGCRFLNGTASWPWKVKYKASLYFKNICMSCLITNQISFKATRPSILRIWSQPCSIVSCHDIIWYLGSTPHLGIPCKKCNQPGGDCYSVGVGPNHNDSWCLLISKNCPAFGFEFRSWRAHRGNFRFCIRSPWNQQPPLQQLFHLSCLIILRKENKFPFPKTTISPEK